MSMRKALRAQVKLAHEQVKLLRAHVIVVKLSLAHMNSFFHSVLLGLRKQQCQNFREFYILYRDIST